MNNVDVGLIEELCAAFGPSGLEVEIAALIAEKAKKYTTEVRTDRMGNVIAVLRRQIPEEEYDPEAEPESDGTPDIKRLMLAAPMDEAGFMVSGFDGAYIKISQLGGADVKTTAGRNVTVSNGNADCEKLIGYFGVKPAHLGGVGNFDSLYIDTGAKERGEDAAFPDKGDYVAFRSEFTRFGSGERRICSKALDSRAPCAVLLTLMEKLAERTDRKCDVYFTFTTRSRISVSGAHAAALDIAPDCAIIVDSLPVTDYLGADRGHGAKLGGGVVLCYADGGALYDRETAEYLISTAEKHGIKHSIYTKMPGGSDTGDVNTVLEGVRTARIALPVRNPSTAAVVADTDDIDALCALLEKAV